MGVSRGSEAVVGSYYSMGQLVQATHLLDRYREVELGINRTRQRYIYKGMYIEVSTAVYYSIV